MMALSCRTGAERDWRRRMLSRLMISSASGVLLPLRDDVLVILHLLDDGAHVTAEQLGGSEAAMAENNHVAARVRRARPDEIGESGPRSRIASRSSLNS